MMIPVMPASMRRAVIPAGVMALGLITASCKLPSRETWSRVQQQGLFPVMFEREPAESPAARSADATLVAGNPAPVVTSPSGVMRVQAVAQPEIARIPFATPVPGLTGYVFSPHLEERKLIDVRKYSAGAEVRCPYTLLAFHVPDFQPVSPAPAPSPVRSVAEMVARDQPASLKESAGSLPVIPAEPTPDHQDPGLPDIPYGSRVPGRPGFVHSPFADKNQLVDVAGIAPGVEVRCPYADKLFRVPEPLPEELVPPVLPAKPPVLPPLPDSPPILPPADPAPIPVPSPAPATPSAVDSLPAAD